MITLPAADESNLAAHLHVTFVELDVEIWYDPSVWGVKEEANASITIHHCIASLCVAQSLSHRSASA